MWHSLLCTSLDLGEAALGMVVWSWEPVSLSPDFEVFYDLLHAPQLSIQPASFSSDTIQLSAEVIEVGVEEGLQVLPDSPGALLLQQVPLGFQDLVLLLQEAHLKGSRENEPHMRS